MKKMLVFAALIILVAFGAYQIRYRVASPDGQSSTQNSEENRKNLPGKILANINTPKPDLPESPAPFATPSAEDSPLIVIDPGHGGNDPGTSDNGLIEKDVVLDISIRLNQILMDSGIHTLMTRSDDSYMDHKDRILLANDKQATLFVSIHCDWFSDASYNGTQTLYYPSKDLKVGNLNEITYAETVQNELIKVIQTKDRGINDRPNLAVLRHAKMPSVLVELGFLSNKNDASRLANPDFRQKVAEGFAKGILKALEKVKD